MHPLELLGTQDLVAREVTLDALREWGRANVASYGGCSLILHGSLARGDFWQGSDVDLIFDGGDETAKERLLAALRRDVPGTIFDAWRLDPPIATFNAKTTAQRKLPSPGQFGLHGFDLVRHHVVLFGGNFLTPFVPTTGQDLVEIAKDRIVKLNTPGETGHGDEPPKKAMEALKAAAMVLAVQGHHPPSRDKRRVLSTFLEGTAGTAIPRDTAIKAWSAYRYGTAPPPVDELLRFVDAVATAFR